MPGFTRLSWSAMLPRLQEAWRFFKPSDTARGDDWVAGFLQRRTKTRAE